ncbi:hypothetical protein COO60DRAFT_1625107 [Scenedesmus sp. NREL 46B-D3]|nr:hypothetical protein COO60DRAFT_1625107 [Scenedesmus sp. NREL 46B-D3]
MNARMSEISSPLSRRGARKAAARLSRLFTGHGPPSIKPMAGGRRLARGGVTAARHARVQVCDTQGGRWSRMGAGWQQDCAGGPAPGCFRAHHPACGQDAHRWRGRLFHQPGGPRRGGRVGRRVAWAEDGIDPGEYSRTLVQYCCEAFEERVMAAARAANKGTFCAKFDPRAVLRYGQQCTCKPGSATVVLAAMQPGGKLHVANLGDCGVKVVRDGKIVHETQPQQHDFNLPYQLSHPRLFPDTDTADSADSSSSLTGMDSLGRSAGKKLLSRSRSFAALTRSNSTAGMPAAAAVAAQEQQQQQGAADAGGSSSLTRSRSTSHIASWGARKLSWGRSKGAKAAAAAAAGCSLAEDDVFTEGAAAAAAAAAAPPKPASPADVAPSDVARAAELLAAAAAAHAADKEFRSPWSVAAGKAFGLLARLFAKGGKMDDITTCHVMFSQIAACLLVDINLLLLVKLIFFGNGVKNGKVLSSMEMCAHFSKVRERTGHPVVPCMLLSLEHMKSTSSKTTHLTLLRSSCGEVHDRHGALAVASEVQGLHWMQDSENLPPNQHPYGVFMALLAPQYTASGGVMPLPHVAASAARRLLNYQHRTKPEPCGLLPLTVLVTGTGLGAALKLPHSVGDTSGLPFTDFTTTFSSVSFESPGVPESLLQQYGSCSNADSRMASYLASSNPINTLHRHPGQDLCPVCQLWWCTSSKFDKPGCIEGSSICSPCRAGVARHAGTAQPAVPQQGAPVSHMMQQMARWPLLFSAAGAGHSIKRSAFSIWPSFLCGGNIGVWTLWEDKLACHMRLVRR